MSVVWGRKKTRFNPNEILDWITTEGFENAWMRSGELLAEQEGELRLDGAGKPHQIPTQMQRLRDIFLKSGFDEIQTPIIMEDEEVYRQYDPEAPIILDRCYYLAALPKPDIGLSNQKYQKIVDLHRFRRG